jgi:putative ABC transport system permease protein
MFRHYLETALRFLRRNSLYTGINAQGLSISLAVSFIILMFVINEISYDHCHRNRKKVFRVVNYCKEFKNTMAGTPYVLDKTLKEEYPQVRATLSDDPLKDLRPIDLSQKLAEQLFPGEDPVRREMKVLINKAEEVFVVSGVFESIPRNSTFQADCLVNGWWVFAITVLMGTLVVLATVTIQSRKASRVNPLDILRYE